jgi:hypothetical protein
MKKQADEEDRLYAMQQEALRRQQIIADRQLKRGLRNVQEEHSAIQQTQTADQKARWVDPYHEKDMEHKHVGNLKL